MNHFMKDYLPAAQPMAAETLAGMVFAAALYRRGLLADAIVAHYVTNALLSAYVMRTHWLATTPSSSRRTYSPGP
jgi:hypothetical protein